MWRRIALPQAIGSVIGTFEGIMPGGGGTISAFLAYNEARRWSRHKEEFGKGSPEGIAAPEAANNTVACTALVPMLSLGIPSSNSSAVLLGGFLIHGLIPGPMLFVKHPDVVNGLYAGLLRGERRDGDPRLPHHDAVPLAGEPPEAVPDGVHLCARRLRRLLRSRPACFMSAWRSGSACSATRCGYFKVPFLPMVLGVVLGFMVESNYRRALVLSGGDHMTFVQDPISAGLLGRRAALRHRLACAPCGESGSRRNAAGRRHDEHDDRDPIRPSRRRCRVARGRRAGAICRPMP